MRFTNWRAIALGVITTVLLGATLLAAIAYDGPSMYGPRRRDERVGIERRPRERQTRTGDRPTGPQRREPGETAADCSHDSVGLTPLTELRDETYKGFEGGLYEGGRNTPPPEHKAAGVALARQIEPLNASGGPDPRGSYVFLSIGMSNSQTEFSEFKGLAESDPARDVAPRRRKRRTRWCYRLPVGESRRSLMVDCRRGIGPIGGDTRSGRGRMGEGGGSNQAVGTTAIP